MRTHGPVRYAETMERPPSNELGQEPARERRWPGLTFGLVLLAALLVVDGLAVWSVVSTRRAARDGARQDLQLQTQVHARSLEALLANLRADLLALSQSPPLLRHVGDDAPGDPMARRWLRLDAESALLLFLQANPAVSQVEVLADDGSRLVAGRLSGAPQILPPEATAPTWDDATGRTVRGAWPVGRSGAQLEAWVDPEGLLAVAAPGLEDRLTLTGPGELPAADSSILRAVAEVEDEPWTTPIRWLLVRDEASSQVLRSFDVLSQRYRTTLLVNAVVILFTLVLAIFAFRQVSRAARLEAENRQQARVRELERRLMHAERLAGVGRLAAGLAHEINNPLAGMTNYLRLLQDDLGEGDIDSARSTAPKLREGLDRVAGVVRQVLAFSDPSRAPKEPLDLRQIVAETADFVAGDPAFEQVAIERQLPDEPAKVDGNATALGQLVLNLVLNACEMQIDGGQVEVSLVVLTGETPQAVLSVFDRGPGFEDDALEHLFEPFYSARGSSGLGLSVCHGIVRDHGGTIEAGNRRQLKGGGEGAFVHVQLPLAEM